MNTQQYDLAQQVGNRLRDASTACRQTALAVDVDPWHWAAGSRLHRTSTALLETSRLVLEGHLIEEDDNIVWVEHNLEDLSLGLRVLARSLDAVVLPTPPDEDATP